MYASLLEIPGANETRITCVPLLPAYAVGVDGSLWTQLNRRGTYTGIWKQRALKPNKRGYRRVIAIRPDGTRRYVKVGVLVLETFVGPCPQGMLMCHKNDVKHDDRLDNLRWGTPSSNNNDAVRNGKVQVSERHHNAKLTNDQVREIRRLRRSGLTYDQIHSRFPIVCKATVAFILSGKNWRYLDA